MNPKPVITVELLNRLKSQRGGYSRASLEYLGYSWPPKRGWRKALMREAAKNQVLKQAGELPVTHSAQDVIKARFMLISPAERICLLQEMRAEYCFLCGATPSNCKCAE